MIDKLDYIPNDLVSLKDYERYAKQRLNLNAFSYVCGASADEITYKRNEEAFKNIFLQTSTLEDLTGANTKIELFGQTYESPIFLAPVAYQKLVDTNGEISTIQGANAMNTSMCVSSFSSCTLEEITSYSSSHLWFQLYIQPDMNINLKLIKKAEELGYKALVVTIDAPISGIRNTEQRAEFFLPDGVCAINIENLNPIQTINDFENILDITATLPTWKDIEFIKKNTRLPIILKGITSVSYAKKAIEIGVDGIVVSNHGGRTIDTLPASIELLPKIAKVVDKRIPILFDGGIRRGTDIVKAIALGASAVMIGRPIMYALVTAGALGVAHTLKILKEELEVSMIFTGCKNIEEIKKLEIINNNYQFC